MIKMMKGEKVTGGTVFSLRQSGNILRYGQCRSHDRIRTEMQHDSRDWEAAHSGWQFIPTPKRCRSAWWPTPTSGKSSTPWTWSVMVIVIPTVRIAEEGKAARDWTMFPPLGKRN